MMTANHQNEASLRPSGLKLVVMGFLTLWWPFVFVWFIQKPEYPVAFRRGFTAWAILWCSCAALFLIVRPY